MLTTKNEFGAYHNQKIDLYTLENTNGMKVKITDYGATITSISVLDGEGNRQELAGGFDTFEGYFGQDYKAMRLILVVQLDALLLALKMESFP